MSDTLFLIIIATIVIQRLIESYLPDFRKIKGIKMAKWTWVAFSVTYPLLILGSVGEYFLISRTINLWVSCMGMVIVAIRIWLKWWAMLTLGEYWSVQIEIRESHKLTRDGPYRYVRHPAYLSNLMEYLGVPLIANAYYVLIGVLIIYIPLNLIRLHLEERELIRKFGKEYEDYRDKVPALFPTKRQILFPTKK
ncbi:MAG: isoprenylcysteine carboxylmethyltransferase family protein [Elusimicrobiota bacterium]|nr:isoprenylcysteine carboxylmethyltransferase family protein [Elusimicrobiota bacterium]